MLAVPVSQKQYDRAYFDRWYRDPRYAVVHQGVQARRVQLAVAVTEYLIERPLYNVLDVGCGEAPWRALLKRARPRVRYTGVDPSEYVVRRFGKSRNIRLGRLQDLAKLGLNDEYDLIVCCDVLHYVSTREALAGLRAIAKRLRGVAMIEVFSQEDDTVGDDDEFQQRGAAVYRRLFREAGLLSLGMHCYVTRDFEDQLTVFERGWGT